MEYTLGSLFDGSGGFPLAGYLCGITPLWASEVEPYPIAVTRSRFPHMKHLGDISKINGAEIEPVDIITFGSPCQDLSVAGKRAGLKHEANGDEETTRSGLFMEAIRIIKEMRCATNGKYPRFALWENVPGAFSSNKGEDFRIVLEEFIKITEENATMPPPPKGGWPYADAYMGDRWSLAYRTFDTQYWGKTVLDRDSGAILQMGTPQRRRRIYLIADLAGGCAPGILFECEGLRRDLAQSKSPRQGAASNTERGAGTDDSKRKPIISSQSAGEQNIAACLCASYGTKWNGNSGAYNGENFVLEEWEDKDNKHLFENHWQEARHQGPLDICPTLPARLGTGGNNTPFVLEEHEENRGIGFDGYNSAVTGDTASTLGVNCGMSSGRNGVLAPYLLKIRSGCEGGGKGALWQENKSHTLSTNNDQYLFQPKGINGDVAGTLDASYYKGCGMRQGVEREIVCVPASFYPQMKAESQCFRQDGVCNTIVNGTNPGFHNGIVVGTEGKSPALYTETDGSIPGVMEVSGFKAGNSAKANGIGWQKEVSPTLAGAPSGTNQTPAVCIAFAQNQRNELRDLNGVAGALAANHGMKQQTYVIEELVLDDQGGQKMSVRTDGKTPTLRAEMHGNIPCVVEASDLKTEQNSTNTIADNSNLPLAYSFDSLGSNSMKSKNPYSGCRQVEIAKTLDTTDPNPCKNQGGIAILQPVAEGAELQYVTQQASEVIPINDKATRFKGGGPSRNNDGSGNGLGVGKIGDPAPTLTAGDHHAVSYLASGKNCTGTLMANAGTKLWLGNQEAFSGDYHIIEHHNAPKKVPTDPKMFESFQYGNYREGCGTLRASGGDYGGGSENLIVSANDSEDNNQEKAEQGTRTNDCSSLKRIKDEENTPYYIVRRLTPTECARLQGFDDNWGIPDHKDDFSDEEYKFWLEVRNTHAAINGKKVKEYSKAQMLAWYNRLHSKASEYKMWGNGVALPPSLYCMSGIYAALIKNQEIR